MGHQSFSFMAWKQELTRVSQSQLLLANDRSKFTLYNRLEIIYICNSKKIWFYMTGILAYSEKFKRRIIKNKSSS